MTENEFKLLIEHIDVKFDSLESKLKDKSQGDRDRDKKIDKIEKRTYTLMIIMAVIFEGPNAISALLGKF